MYACVTKHFLIFNILCHLLKIWKILTLHEPIKSTTFLYANNDKTIDQNKLEILQKRKAINFYISRSKKCGIHRSFSREELTFYVLTKKLNTKEN